jgi:hypothetical protein
MVSKATRPGNIEELRTWNYVEAGVESMLARLLRLDTISLSMCADTVIAPEDFSSASDEELVSRVCAGEQSLFEIIMRRSNRRVYRTVRAIAGDDREAEDVLQAAYVRAYQNLGQFEGHTRFTIWLIRIAVHEALARRRRDGRSVAISGPGLAGGFGPGRRVE